MSAEWPLYSLSEFIGIKHGFAFKGEFFQSVETDDVLVTPGNFAIGGGFKADKFKYYDGPVPEDYILEEGDLVVTMTDLSKQADTLGYSALIPTVDGHRLLHNQRVGLVEYKNDELDKTYLFFLLRSREYRNHVLGGVTGTTVKHTSPTKILSYEFRKPPFKVQVEIGRQLIALEDKIDLNHQTNQTLEQIAQAIFKSWFVDFEPTRAKIIAQDMGANSATQELAAQAIICGAITLEQLTDTEPQTLSTWLEQSFLQKLSQANPTGINPDQLKTTAALLPNALVESELGEIPEGWEVNTMEDIVDIGSAKRIFSKEYVADGVPFFRGKEVTELSEGNNINPEIFIENKRYQELKEKHGAPKEHDILITSVGTIGNTYLVRKGDEFYFKDGNLTWIKAYKKGQISYYLKIWFDNPVGKNSIGNIKIGSTQQAITITSINKIKLIMPSAEAHAVFSQLIQSNFDKRTENLKQIKLLSKLRDTLLPKLLSGELDVSALADDSAPAIKTKEAFDV